MKRILLALGLLISASAWAQGAPDICTGLPLANNCYLSAARGDGFVEVKVLKVDTTDDTVLNADAGDTIKFSIGGTTEVTVDDNSMTFSGATFTLSSAGDVILKTDNDAQRLLTFGASSDTALTLQWGDAGTTATQILTFSPSTADADDDATLQLGFASGTRGAGITLPGEEVSGGGDITYNAGTGDQHIFSVAGTARLLINDNEISPNAAGGIGAGSATLPFSTVVAGTGTINTNLSASAGESAGVVGTVSNHALNIRTNGSTVFTVGTTGTLIGTGTATLGWAVVAGANTACTTTCTTPCVFGVNTAATEADIVSCADATADECLCAGAT